jgi:hypothetical protein
MEVAETIVMVLTNFGPVIATTVFLVIVEVDSWSLKRHAKL